MKVRLSDLTMLASAVVLLAYASQGISGTGNPKGNNSTAEAKPVRLTKAQLDVIHKDVHDAADSHPATELDVSVWQGKAGTVLAYYSVRRGTLANFHTKFIEPDGKYYYRGTRRR